VPICPHSVPKPKPKPKFGRPLLLTFFTEIKRQQQAPCDFFPESVYSKKMQQSRRSTMTRTRTTFPRPTAVNRSQYSMRRPALQCVNATCTVLSNRCITLLCIDLKVQYKLHYTIKHNACMTCVRRLMNSKMSMQATRSPRLGQMSLPWQQGSPHNILHGSIE